MSNHEHDDFEDATEELRQLGNPNEFCKCGHADGMHGLDGTCGLCSCQQMRPR